MSPTSKAPQAVCLVGTYTAETDNPRFGDAEIAVLALRSKDRNPAAAKIDTLWAERKMLWSAVSRD